MIRTHCTAVSRRGKTVEGGDRTKVKETTDGRRRRDIKSSVVRACASAYNRQAIKIDRVDTAPGGAVWTILTKERGGGNCAGDVTEGEQ